MNFIFKKAFPRRVLTCSSTSFVFWSTRNSASAICSIGIISSTAACCWYNAFTVLGGLVPVPGATLATIPPPPPPFTWWASTMSLLLLLSDRSFRCRSSWTASRFIPVADDNGNNKRNKHSNFSSSGHRSLPQHLPFVGQMDHIHIGLLKIAENACDMKHVIPFGSIPANTFVRQYWIQLVSNVLHEGSDGVGARQLVHVKTIGLIESRGEFRSCAD